MKNSRCNFAVASHFRPLWCLRGESFIQRTDNGRNSITAAGVEAYEEIENGMPEGPQKAIEGDRLPPAM